MSTDTLTPPPATRADRAPAAPVVPEDSVGAVFASRSVLEHYVRGVVGLVLVVAALVGAGTTAWALLLAVPGVVAWRGCPTCWALGLSATLARRASTCVDGSCRRG
ncbi:MAG: hypothetical protein JWR20_1624 [Marmoricola sp.]|nr:hypothetical protein [Marmoricola sp.]